MAKVEGVKSLQAKLKALAEKVGPPKASVVVGYSQEYGIFVHENLEARHPVGQAKFLEQPFRELAADGTLVGIVEETLKKGGELGTGLLLAGLRLQRESQLLTPVDTGALRASAYTREES